MNMPRSSSSTSSSWLRSTRVVADGRVQPLALCLDGDVIADIREHAAVPGDATLDDVGDLLVLPGLCDTHVHINEPGRTEWEGFVTATRAAAAGGITTVVDMPLNCIPVTTTLAALDEKARHARGHTMVDHAFWGGVVPGNSGDLEPMIRAGVRGFKCFLVHSGVDDFPNVTESDLRLAMPILARHGATLLVHAELPGPIEEASERLAAQKKDPRAYDTFLASRPRASENAAIAMMVHLCRETRCRVHIVHLSSSDAVPLLRDARREGLPITSETCPHYLTFAAEEIPDGTTTFKCCPPVRERENRELLWRALAEGDIDMVVSDHSPCTPGLKRLDTGDFLAAWGGISSVQLGLPAIWTEATRRGHAITDVVRWMCETPARMAGLGDRKGRIAKGYDADLAIFDPDHATQVRPDDLEHRHKLSPYAARTLRGKIMKTILRGRVVCDHGVFPEEPRGRRLMPAGTARPASHHEEST